MEKTRRARLGLLVSLIIIAAAFGGFAWFVLQPNNPLGILASFCFGLILAALIGLAVILDEHAQSRLRRFGIDLLAAVLILGTINFFLLDFYFKDWLIAVWGGLALIVVALLALRPVNNN